MSQKKNPIVLVLTDPELDLLIECVAHLQKTAARGAPGLSDQLKKLGMKVTSHKFGQAADDIAVETRDAYSADRYVSWAACAQLLLDRGMTKKQVEAVLRSKHMRWAADNARDDGRATHLDLARYMDEPRNRVEFTPAALDRLVAG